MGLLRRAKTAISSLLVGRMQDSVPTDVANPLSARPHLSPWEARDTLRAMGLNCSAEDITDWARDGTIEAYKYNGRWRISTEDLIRWFSRRKKQTQIGVVRWLTHPTKLEEFGAIEIECLCSAESDFYRLSFQELRKFLVEKPTYMKDFMRKKRDA